MIHEVLHALPRWPEDTNGGEKPSGIAYEERVSLVQDNEKLWPGDIGSAFEFGGHYGWGLVTWLNAFPLMTQVGWTDNESAFEGSNAACERNIRAYLEATRRRADLWYSDFVADAVGMHYELVLVDGDHSYVGTLTDLALAWAMKPKVMLVDDLPMDAVRAALDDWSRYTGVPYEEHMEVGAGTALIVP